MYCVAVYIFPIVPQVKRASLDFEDGGILIYVQLAREKKNTDRRGDLKSRSCGDWSRGL